MQGKNNRIIVFGGDGFCGWPAALRLSNEGYEVTIVDNLSRRKIDIELECESLTPITPLKTRIDKWKELTGKEIAYEYIDISLHYKRLIEIFERIKPTAVVHFAEQRSAPYSMKSSIHKRYTLNNNLNATNNILSAMIDSGIDCHVVHLGSTGYYGYSSIGMKIPEGYLPVKVDVNGEEKTMNILYPPNPGSIYHLTKCQDALTFHYYNKNDGIRVTDLHQGIVWGTQTPETKMDEALINRFDYDGDYGTVLNRFLVQSQVGHPLTVHGTGGQTRAFIHIKNTTDCILLAIKNPPGKGDKYRVFNQTTECLNINDLAKKIKGMTGAKIRYYKNPRKEDSYNDLEFENAGLLNLGLKPITLDDGLLEEVSDIAKKYKHRVDKSKIPCTSTWTKDIIADTEGVPEDSV
ncbi:MAG: NAD-dependent epimerase/dehydratase family protein [Nanobdellota archaeon]